MRRKLLFVAIAVMLLVISFIALKPKRTAAPDTNTSQNPPATKTLNLVIKDRKVASADSVLKVTQGDAVVISILSDEDEELHLHGYDKAVELHKDKPAELRFTANITGNFPYELERSGAGLGSLQVLPK
ncbi:MAG TPA: hypothetical protein VM124_01995 [Candidatus Limnocylindrales bacterium]|nr:hypothetical protein [Candidatus Limnocylindrales bacterium]